MSHIIPSSQVDSTGVDATDTTNHAVRVTVVAGGSGGGTVDQGTGGTSPWLVKFDLGIPVQHVLDYSGDNLIYFGLAAHGAATSAAAWQIRKLDYSGSNLITIKSANGTDTFTNIWDDRVSLSYS